MRKHSSKSFSIKFKKGVDILKKKRQKIFLLMHFHYFVCNAAEFFKRKRTPRHFSNHITFFVVTSLPPFFPKHGTTKQQSTQSLNYLDVP